MPYRLHSAFHHQFRHNVEWDLANEYAAKGLSPIERMQDRFTRLCDEEKAVILENEQIVFLRTVSNLPAIFTDSEWDEINLKKLQILSLRRLIFQKIFLLHL